MQKKLIALAVAGLVSGAAFAQTSNVTIYGYADVGYRYYSDAINSSSKSVHAIDSGDINTVRVGFKGSEDLGNGLTANFDMQLKFAPDTTATQGAYRKSYVSLASKTLGEVKLGSFGTFEDDLHGATNVMMGNATRGQAGIVYLAGDSYYNAAGYFSPVWSGFQIKAAVSTAGTGGEVEPVASVGGAQATAATNQRRYALAGHYVNGPIVAGLTMERNKYQNVSGLTNSYDSGSQWHLMGSYDFGVVRVNAGYGQINYAQNDAEKASATGKDNRKQWQVGLSAPVGAQGLFAINYAHAKIGYIDSATRDDKIGFWGAAYFHNLSKRTIIYTAYGDINQDDANVAANKANFGPNAAYQQAFSLGLRHAF